MQREVMNYDVVIVGGGPAGLASAIHFKQLRSDWNVCVLEKSSEIGAHSLSGAVIDPEPLDILLPHWRREQLPVCTPVAKDQFFILTTDKRRRFATPPQMKNKRNFIISLGGLCRFLAKEAEQLGVDVFAGFSGQQALTEDGVVVGIRCGDMGVQHDGTHGANFVAGVDIRARFTVLAEGCRGNISKQLIHQFKLDKDASPQTYGLGFKELWRLPSGRVKPGLVQHTVGYPLDKKTYGGSFIYHLNDNQLYLGFVVGLDYENPDFDPYKAFQQFKHHPSIAPLLKDGEILSAGARTLVEGGYQSLPKLDMPGAVLTGDSAGLLNVPKIKGVHMALSSGMLAAEHIVYQETTKGFDQYWRASKRGKELRKVRNIRPGFRWGFWPGLLNAMFETLTKGYVPWTLNNHADHSALKKLADIEDVEPEITTDLSQIPPRDRLASVYYANIGHDEDQPVHLHVTDTSICVDRCRKEFNNPCTRFCPAKVYEMVEDEQQGWRLQINAANCIHCKACDIKDPYQIINWVPPEGGSGPNYENL
ncbi:MAG: electron transfer flavoprotein-ubiquinone oxidoreductase [Gammaproteobacteria bacterium]|nr:electron transfer flavoprotein-ubiquinone oxidoreductase [Gammaproteobacteria bacterium]